MSPSHLLLLLPMLFCNHLFAQEIDPIAISEEGNWVLWTNEATQVWDPESNTYIWVGEDFYRYLFSDGDTLIGGEEYIKMYEDALTYNKDGTFYKENYPYYVFAYRNDEERKVYKVDYGQTEPYLWYDFDGDLNESVSNTPAFNEVGDELLITNLTAVTLCDVEYQMFHFNGAMGEFSNTNAIQRAGNTRNFIQATDFGFQWDTLMHFCEGVDAFEELILLDPANGIEENQKEAITVFPIPCANQLLLNGIDQQKVYSISVFDLSGRLNMHLTGQQLTVDVEALQAGVYVLVVKLAERQIPIRFIKE